MEDFAGSYGHNRPKHAWIVLNTCNIFYVISTQKIRTFDGHLRLLPAILTTNLDPIIRKGGMKFDELKIALERHFWGSLKCVKVCKPELLTRPQIGHPCNTHRLTWKRECTFTRADTQNFSFTHISKRWNAPALMLRPLDCLDSKRHFLVAAGWRSYGSPTDKRCKLSSDSLVQAARMQAAQAAVVYTTGRTYAWEGWMRLQYGRRNSCAPWTRQCSFRRNMY